jgi:hypothetical protein
MESSRSTFTTKELLADKWFKMSLLGSIACAASVLAGIAVWNYRDKISVRPIAEVVRLDGDRGTSFEVKPISEITSDQKSEKPIAWTGWAIPLHDLCQTTKGDFSQDFSDEFQKGTAKLVIPASGGTAWTVANADLSANNCAQVTGNDRSQGIYAVFDAKIPAIADRQVKYVFVSTHGAYVRHIP